MCKSLVYNFLKENGGLSEYVDIVNVLNDSDSEVLAVKDDGILVKCSKDNLGFMVANSKETAIELGEISKNNCISEICMRRIEFAKFAATAAGFEIVEGNPCYIASQIKPEILPETKNIEFKPLIIDNLAYVKNNYNMANILGEEYLKERIASGNFWGGFLDGKIFGFIGCHSEGSMGMLFIHPDYRKRGLGKELEIRLINLLVKRGGHPYCHIFQDNKISISLHKSLGFIFGKQKLIWL